MNDSLYNLAFICSICNKKYHFSKLSTSEVPTCIHCHHPDELEAAIRDEKYFMSVTHIYMKDELKTLFRELEQH